MVFGIAALVAGAFIGYGFKHYRDRIMLEEAENEMAKGRSAMDEFDHEFDRRRSLVERPVPGQGKML